MRQFFILTLKYICYAVVLTVALLLLYGLAVLLLPKIEMPAEKTAAPKPVTIFILTNGVHTDIVMPLTNEYIDWSTRVDQHKLKKQNEQYNYLAVGWGDRGFFLNTPTWAELKASVAFEAAFGLSTTAIHATFYKDMSENDSCVAIPLTVNQYKRLGKYVEASFQQENGRFIHIETDAVYGDNDVFYEAKGVYSLFKTCNTWSNSALKVAGQKYCFWTATKGGIFDLYQ